jgi:hypothetical protein
MARPVINGDVSLRHAGRHYRGHHLVRSGGRYQRRDRLISLLRVSLINEIGSGSGDDNFDSDGDGLTDFFEINVSGTSPIQSTTITTGPLPDPGDVDANGNTDVADLLKLQQVLIGE